MHGQCSRAAMCFPCGHSDPAWCSFTMRALVFPRALVQLLPRLSEGCSPGVRKWICQSHAYEELVEVVTKVVD